MTSSSNKLILNCRTYVHLTFVCDLTCRKNHLNFNDWISNGITFTDRRGEAWARRQYGQESQVKDAEKKQERRCISLSKQSDIDRMDDEFTKLATALEMPDFEFFEFQGCNSFLRRYIYEQVSLYLIERGNESD